MEQIINKIRNKMSLIQMFFICFDWHPCRLQGDFYLYQQKLGIYLQNLSWANFGKGTDWKI